MQNRTFGIIATIVTALACGCASLFSCIWGFIIASGSPIDITTNGATTPQTLPPAIGYGLLCLSVLMLLVPAGIGFFTFRKRPELPEVIPPPS